MEIIDNRCVDLKIKKSNDIKVIFSETEELTLMRLSAFNLNKKEIIEHSNSSYKEIRLSQNRIKRLMAERKWERVLLKSFKKGILLFNDYTMSEVCSMALIYAERIEEKMETGTLDDTNVIDNYREELSSFIEEAKNSILQNFMERHENFKGKKLSEREWIYLDLVLNGYVQPEILNRLKINIGNLKNCKWSIFRYLGVKNWFNAIRMIFLLDLIQPSKKVKENISNQIFKSAKELNVLEDISNSDNKRNLRIYILLVTLFNKIEFDILFNRCNIEE